VQSSLPCVCVPRIFFPSGVEHQQIPLEPLHCLALKDPSASHEGIKTPNSSFASSLRFWHSVIRIRLLRIAISFSSSALCFKSFWFESSCSASLLYIFSKEWWWLLLLFKGVVVVVVVVVSGSACLFSFLSSAVVAPAVNKIKAARASVVIVVVVARASIGAWDFENIRFLRFCWKIFSGLKKKKS